MDNERIFNCWYKDVCTQDCTANCIRYIEMKHLMDTSEIPKNMQVPKLLEASGDYKAFCRLAEIKENIVEFVQSGQNLYITSVHTGNGKTSWAIKLMLKYFDEIWAGNGLQTRGLFVHVPTFLLKAKDFKEPLSEEYKQALLDCDLVIWDDIASMGVSQYDFSQLLMYIDNRLLKGRANIYTSNTTKYELVALLGSKLASRIYNTAEIITFTGKDRRHTNGSVADNQ